MTLPDPTRRGLMAMAGGTLALCALPACSRSGGTTSDKPQSDTPQSAAKETAMANPTHYRTANVDGIDIFYREAGPKDAPTIMMFHGYPTSSRMYRDLIPMLSDRYHVIAPDYPAFGHSAVPARDSFDYTHQHLADVMDALMTKLGVGKFGLYLQDFGGPIGYRIMLKHQDRFGGVVLQNTPAFGEQNSPDSWGPLLVLWKDPKSAANRDAVRKTMSPAAIKEQYTAGVKDVTELDPDSWELDNARLARPGISDIMIDLLYGIKDNKPVIEEAKTFLKSHQKLAMIATGVGDPLFPGKSMEPPADMKDIEFHGVDSGHFALENKVAEIGPLARAFYDRTLGA